MRIFNQFPAIGFKAIINIMKMNACERTHHPIEDARWKCFGDGIKSRKFPTRDQIISFIQFLQKARNLLWIILQIAIHSKDDLATTTAKTSHQSRGFAKIATKANHTHNTSVL